MSFFDRFRADRSSGGNEEGGGEKKSIFASVSRGILNELNSNAEKDREQYREDAGEFDAFLKVLRGQCRRRFTERRGDGDDSVLDAGVCFHLTKDRMRAYACILPPVNGGMDIDMENFQADTRYEGVVYGLQTDLIEEYTGNLMYLHIFLVAKGTFPQDGREGDVQDLFPRREAEDLEVTAESIINFHSRSEVQVIRKGDAICRIHPAVPGRDGTDVAGGKIPCRQVKELFIPAGENTVVSEDGQSLTAALDGILFTKDNCFCVQRQKLIQGDLDGTAPGSGRGEMNVNGDLMVTGNVCGGIRLRVTGNILIEGRVVDADISCQGTLRAQKGIHGVEGQTVLNTGRQLQAASIEHAVAEVGSDVITEVIQDSQIHCGGLLNVKGGRGMIIGGDVTAEKEIRCLQIGNLAGVVNRVAVGCSLEFMDRIDILQKELKPVQETLEKLRKNISNLRMAGSHISLEKREVLNKLVEQRALYEEQEGRLQKELKQSRERLQAIASSCRIYCQELYPVTVIRIGIWTEEFRMKETSCSLRMQGGRIVVR